MHDATKKTIYIFNVETHANVLSHCPTNALKLTYGKVYVKQHAGSYPGILLKVS